MQADDLIYQETINSQFEWTLLIFKYHTQVVPMDLEMININVDCLLVSQFKLSTVM
jgi:hypothetical protein